MDIGAKIEPHRRRADNVFVMVVLMNAIVLQLLQDDGIFEHIFAFAIWMFNKRRNFIYYIFLSITILNILDYLVFSVESTHW